MRGRRGRPRLLPRGRAAEGVGAGCAKARSATPKDGKEWKKETERRGFFLIFAGSGDPLAENHNDEGRKRCPVVFAS